MARALPADAARARLPARAEPLLEVESLRAYYQMRYFGISREVRAVDDLTLTIPDKEFVTLLGPSGCGKTTTLNMVAGLVDVTAGEIFIGGREVTDVDPKDRDIAMVFQNYALYPSKTVYGNLAFPLRMRRYPRDEIDRRVQRSIEEVASSIFE